MARNMHGVDQDHATVKAIARESGVHEGFITAMIEFYSDAVRDDEIWTDDGETQDQSIRIAVTVAAFGYKDQDDDEDERQTRLLRQWALKS